MDAPTYDVRNYDGCDPRTLEATPAEAEEYMNYLTKRNPDFAAELAKHILLTFDGQGHNVEMLGGNILDSKVLR